MPGPTTEHPTDDPRVPIAEIDLAVGGMTCASCVARVEKRLNRLPGVEATVNLPLESAHVVLHDEVDEADLVAAVGKAGYDARVTGRRRLDASAGRQDARSDEHREHPAGDGHPGSPSGESSPAPLGSRAQQPATHAADHAHSSDEMALSGHSMAEGHVMVDGEDTSAPTPDRGADLRRRLVVSTVLSVPVVLLSMIPALQLDGWQWLVASLALPVVTWSAWPFHRAAFRAARHGASTMDTLVSVGVVAATAWSLWALLFGGAGEIGMRMTPTLFPAAEHAAMAGPELYFEVAAVVTTFLLAGRYAEHRSRRRAGDALRSLLALGAKDVTVLRTDDAGRRVEQRVPVESLRTDDLFVVRPGEKVATDGVVVEGTSAVDASLLTGEPVPVDVGPGDPVTGATISTSGHLVVRATRVGDETTLAQIGRLVSAAQTGKAPVQRLADRISAVFVPVVFVIAVATFAAWMVWGDSTQSAFTAAVAVLIIACPCALGLATPTALLVGTGRGAQLGVLIKGPEILESTRRVDTVVLDKTGTVTQGRMAVEGVVGDERTLRLAGAVEALSEHPIAQAIAAAAQRERSGQEHDGLAADGSAGARDDRTTSSASVGSTVDVGQDDTGQDGVVIGSDQVLDFSSAAGGGVSGVVRVAHSGLDLSPRVLVGRLSWLAEQGMTVDDDEQRPLRDAVAEAERSGATAVVAAWDGAARGVVVLRDPVEESSAQAVAELTALGLRPILLTGDNPGAARVAAEQVGIAAEDVIAQVVPSEKAEVVARLRAEGRVVAMVGDGVNDAAALAGADLGLAMGTGTDVAIEASDITLVRGDLRSAATAIRLSRQTLRIIQQNLFWAFAYNVAAIPLAALGLLNPMIAGAAMAASSVIVVGNSLRLRRAG